MNAIIIIFLFVLLGTLIYTVIRVNKLISMLSNFSTILFKNIETLGINQKQLFNSLSNVYTLLASKMNKK